MVSEKVDSVVSLGPVSHIGIVVEDCVKAAEWWDWTPSPSMESLLEEIARHAEENPHWLELSNPKS